jgi:arylsulfatase A-like enzyme
MGSWGAGYPGYNTIIGPQNATIGEILKENGYATSWFGKDHNTPSSQYSVAGPFDQWWKPLLCKELDIQLGWAGRAGSPSRPVQR